MEKKKENAFKQRLVSAIKSNVVRNLIIFGILILSVFCMLLLDKGNYVRTKYMAGLSENFIADLLDVLNVQRYNIGLESWLIFFTVIGVVSIFLIANMFSHLFVDKMVEKKGHKFNTEKEAKRFYTALYYLFVLIFSAVVVFIFIMAGGFDMFREEATGVFVDLLYTLLICLIFGAIVILALALVGLILRGIFGFISLLATGFLKAARTDDTKGTGKGGAATADGGSFKATIEKNALLDKDLFPALTAIDNANAEEGVAQVEVDEVALDDLVLRFQSYACNNHKIYYELPLLRSFIAGMAASRLIILEGLSGTGKSLLPRMFARFTNSDVFFSPVQATWRDKTDVEETVEEIVEESVVEETIEEVVEEPVVEETVEEVVEEPVVEETVEEIVAEPVVEEAVEEIVEEPVVEETVEEIVEEPVVEETIEKVVEEPVVEETIEEVVEEIAPAVAEETATEEDDEDDDEDDDETDVQVIQTRRRFLAKLEKLNKKSKAYYDEIRAFVLSHKKVHSRMGSSYESFTMHRIAKARMLIRGKDIAVCLALNAKDYEQYFFKDLTTCSYDDTPMMVTLKSDRDVRLIKEVLDTLLKN